ncbi:conserved hypothetical protein [Talaromyces stipitatus ATCC 10500]|uniref:Heterokaryon incompatibility domain-containing protein n=1 Tax=Talaromyces stipitatus (strain ATCC 10500 / CBS 375.48 / QM 6759 / NRRL 1006) TaxID=441959 RepID=B8MRN4_TALSN|nr:uncharacterized protein TSTA_056880 [Talaromyces stipitatus ATCC 10500]EED13191.1 conserved hypothetical protein [Talaromyces stipitatus ATCC 10500]
MDNNNLCEACKTIPSLRELNNCYYTLHEKFEDFQSCRCHFCRWLYTYLDSKSSFRDDFRKIAKENAAVELFGNMMFPKEGDQLQSLSLDSGSETFLLYLFTRYDNPAAKYIWGRIVDIDPSSDEAVNLTKSWLSDCQNNHPKCGGAPGEDIALPTYLIDLGENESDRSRLIQTGSTQHDRRYIALSYVWGIATQPIMLTRNTKADLMDEIPEAKLPQTHRDAIRIARWLDVRYLWIDALCIIQDDDKESKMKEIGRMHLTFGNAFLTVQAARAASVHDGFLSPRVDTEETPEIPYPSIGTDGSRVFVRTKIYYYSDGPTFSRAWCYEESVLPRRILTYTNELIKFRCMKQTCDDYGRISKSIMKSPHVFQDPSPWYKGTAIPKSVWDPDPTLDLLKVWYSILDLHYTPRLLTKPGDRLVAIGGLTRRFRERMPGAYIAGLWQVDLPWGLLWECRRGKSSGFFGVEIIKASGQTNGYKLSMMRPEGYDKKRAPSWSWAALNGPVSHPSMNFRFYLEGELRGTKRRVLSRIDEVPRPLVSEGSARSGLGEYEGDGALYITAPLLLVDLVYKDEERWNTLYEQTLATYKRNDLMIGDRPLTILQSPRINVESHSWDNLPIGHAQLDLNEDEYKPRKVWCLLILDGRGLVLDAVDEEKNVFVRTGSFHTTKGIWLDSLNDVPPTSLCVI